MNSRVIRRVWWIRKNHVNYSCELVDRAQYGTEAQIYRETDLMISRRFETEALAVQVRLAFPSLIVQALAPSAGALLLEAKGANATIGVLTLFALINVALIGLPWWLCRKP